MATNGKVTLAVLATKLDNMTELLQQHREDFKQHLLDDKLVAERVSTTDTTIKVLKWVVGIGFAILSLVVAWFK